MDKEPLDGRREGLDEAGLHVVGAQGLAIGLVQLLYVGPRPLRDPGHVAAEDRLEAGKVHRALVVHFPPEGANREHHIMGLCDERLGVGDPHVQNARRARGLQSDGPSQGLPLLGDFLGVAAREVFDGALAVGRQACAQLQMSSSRVAACLSSSSCSWLCVAGRNPCDAPCSSSVSRMRCLGVDAHPGRVCLVRRQGARRQGVVVEDRRL